MEQINRSLGFFREIYLIFIEIIFKRKKHCQIRVQPFKYSENMS